MTTFNRLCEMIDGNFKIVVADGKYIITTKHGAYDIYNLHSEPDMADELTLGFMAIDMEYDLEVEAEWL